MSVVGTVARPLWEVYLGKNGEVVASGADQLPFISRAVISMVYMDWRLRCDVRACISYDCIWSIEIFESIVKNLYCSGIFNINEPVIFGLPIVLNQF